MFLLLLNRESLLLHVHLNHREALNYRDWIKQGKLLSSHLYLEVMKKFQKVDQLRLSPKRLIDLCGLPSVAGRNQNILIVYPEQLLLDKQLLTNKLGHRVLKAIQVVIACSMPLKVQNLKRPS